MITGGQLRAARALINMDRKTLAGRAGLSLPTIQRMESASGVVGGSVDSLVKVVEVLRASGVELIGDNQHSPAGGRGVRLVEPATE